MLGGTSYEQLSPDRGGCAGVGIFILRGRPPGRTGGVAAPVRAREAANRTASTAPRRRAATVGPRTRFLAACAGEAEELAVVRWVRGNRHLSAVLLARASLEVV